MKEVNSLINAVVADRFEDARKDAAEVDRVLESGSLPDELSERNAPYLGVPFTTKEAVSVAGNVTTRAERNCCCGCGLTELFLVWTM